MEKRTSEEALSPPSRRGGHARANKWNATLDSARPGRSNTCYGKRSDLRPLLEGRPLQKSRDALVGAVYDRELFPEFKEIRAVTDRAYNSLYF
jgi:hypothetical protein